MSDKVEYHVRPFLPRDIKLIKALYKANDIWVPEFHNDHYLGHYAMLRRNKYGRFDTSDPFDLYQKGPLYCLEMSGAGRDLTPETWMHKSTFYRKRKKMVTNTNNAGNTFELSEIEQAQKIMEDMT